MFSISSYSLIRWPWARGYIGGDGANTTAEIQSPDILSLRVIRFINSCQFPKTHRNDTGMNDTVCHRFTSNKLIQSSAQSFWHTHARTEPHTKPPIQQLFNPTINHLSLAAIQAFKRTRARWADTADEVVWWRCGYTVVSAVCCTCW